MVVPLLGAAHATCSPRGCKASEYVVFDAEDEPPGTSADGAASPASTRSRTRLACDVSATRHARRHSVALVAAPSNTIYRCEEVARYSS